MKTLDMFRNRLPIFVIIFCVCIAAAISAAAGVKENAREASAGASAKKVVVIDAGHDASVIN